jgi:carbamate kinase
MTLLLKIQLNSLALFTLKKRQKTLKLKMVTLSEKISGRGWRRVVPSPKPVDILEKNAIHKNLEMGHVVIAVGGGGIPVIEKNGLIEGVEAVIDKDHASRKLAELIDADILLVLTGVEAVSINFGKPDQKQLYNTTVSELEKYIQEKQFPAGSMLPKVEAAVAFVKSKPGRMSIITSLESAKDALKDNVGTKITS